MRTILAWCGILAVFEFGAYGAEAAPGGSFARGGEAAAGEAGGGRGVWGRRV